MPRFCTENHFAANPPWSQPDINTLKPVILCRLQRACKIILWGHRSLYLVSTSPLQASPPPFNFRRAFVHGGYGTERLGYSLNYLCKVNSLYAFETQFEGLVPTFCSRIVIHKGYYKRPLSYRNTCSKWWDCRAFPTPEPLTCCATAPATRCTSVSQPFTGLSCSSFTGLVPSPAPVTNQEMVLL